jgi:hypothetical protein
MHDSSADENDGRDTDPQGSAKGVAAGSFSAADYCRLAEECMTLAVFATTTRRKRRSSSRQAHPETLTVSSTLCRNQSLHCQEFALGTGDSEAAARTETIFDDRRRTSARTRESGPGGTSVVATLGRFGSRCLRLAFWAGRDSGATARAADRATRTSGPARSSAIRDPEGSDSDFLTLLDSRGRADRARSARAGPAAKRPRRRLGSATPR